MSAEQQSATDHARALLRTSLHSNVEIARLTGLHRGYVRKIRQRDAGADAAWQRWRDRNPETVRRYRKTQNDKRRNRVLASSQQEQTL